MNALLIPPTFFQTLTEAESHLTLTKQLIDNVANEVAKNVDEHPEKASLAVHLHYIRASSQELQKAHARVNLMRNYFIPDL